MKKTTHYVMSTGLLVFISSFFYTSFIFSQGIGINETSTEPDPSAMLDVSSETKGFLPPRMTTAQRDAIENPTEGLVIYNLTLHCLEYWNGTGWFNWCNGQSDEPDEPEEFTCGDEVTFTYKGAEVTYGTVLGVGDRCWLDRNLGASQVATSTTDVDAYGDLFQWGRGDDGHQNRTSQTTSTLSTTDQPGHGDFITSSAAPEDWRSPQNNNLWQGVDGVNNPCPSGFRVPTEQEFNAERLAWSSNSATGAFESSLKLTMTGGRSQTSGTVLSVGFSGQYWTSTVSGTESIRLFFNTTQNAEMNAFRRGFGNPVRCIYD